MSVLTVTVLHLSVLSIFVSGDDTEFGNGGSVIVMEVVSLTDNEGMAQIKSETKALHQDGRSSKATPKSQKPIAQNRTIKEAEAAIKELKPQKLRPTPSTESLASNMGEGSHQQQLADRQGIGGQMGQEASVDRMATMRYAPRPRYPLAEKKAGLEGDVKMAIYVNAHGRVDRAEVLVSSGHFGLDAAALEAVRRWRFQPAYRGDLAVEQRCVLTVRFRLKDEK
jgi:protein TonB